MPERRRERRQRQPRALVVIVEDDAAIAEGLALNLKLLGYRTEVIGDGETARAAHRASGGRTWCCSTSRCPSRAASGCSRRLREAQDHVPVIVLSARQDEFDKVAALRLGADDYVTKPFALAELLARVDGRAAPRAPERARRRAGAAAPPSRAPPTRTLALRRRRRRSRRRGR